MRSRVVVACLSAFAVALGGLAAGAAPVSATTALAPDPAAERALRAASSGPVKITRGNDGVARFVGTTAGKPVRRPAGLAASSSPETVARAHLAHYGALFGLRDQASELRRQRVTGTAGRSQIVRFGQRLGGLPVLGGELSVALDAAGNLLSVNGETARSVGPTSFATPAVTAARTAISSAAKANRVKSSALRASAPQRWIYDASLVGPPTKAAPRSVWRVEVRATDGAPVRQLVLVDGTTGAVALSFNQIAYAKERHICDFDNVPNEDNTCQTANSVRDEGDPATGVPDVDLAYTYSGDTYDFYATQLGRDSIDGGGLPLFSTVRYCPDAERCAYKNAFWDGRQMTYGDGFAGADDVVAHELTHGVTEYTSGLLYYYESGAINESLSDIFGEFVDLGNGAGNDAAGVRWQLGEDLPPFWQDPAIADPVLRDMKNPPAYGNPDKTSSPLWNSNWADAGGVHGNSGVNNKAAYLMTDGATFNGRPVTGLGIPKVAAIYYEAQQLLTSGADHRDLFNVLQQSCANLIGTKGITIADCTEVTDAVNAVEMHLYPANDAPLPAAPATCDGSAVTRFSDNFNGSLAKWTAAGPWTTNDWYQPNPTAGNALFVPDDNASVDYRIATTQAFVVPYARSTYLRFDHAYSFDWIGPNSDAVPVAYYDGGFVEVTTNNGATWTTISIAANGYNSKLEAPLSRSAFSGDSRDWISSQATLSTYAGKSVKLRFRIATDGVSAVSSAYGWWLDNVKVYSCAPRPKADYDGDGKADTATWRPSTGVWTIPGLTPTAYGASGDVPLAGDFTGDAKSDLAVYRPSTGQWHIKNGLPAVNYGNSTDKPVAADYNGEGKADIAIWRPSNGTWNVRGQPAYAYGVSGDIPLPADFTGDGKADFAVWRPSTGTWYVKGMPAVVWGTSGDKPAVADYTGDGKADIAVWRPSNNTWYVRNVSTTVHGMTGAVPVPGDFTGDGRADITYWLAGNWVRPGQPPIVGGAAGDVPLR